MSSSLIAYHLSLITNSAAFLGFETYRRIYRAARLALPQGVIDEYVQNPLSGRCGANYSTETGREKPDAPQRTKRQKKAKRSNGWNVSDKAESAEKPHWWPPRKVRVLY